MKAIFHFAGMALVTIAAILLSGPAQAECPARKRVEEVIAKFEAQDRRLISVQPTDYPGLCEAHVQLNGKTHIFYTGPGGDFFIMGQLYDSSSGRNVTRDTLEAITVFSTEEMSRMAELSAFTIGQQGKALFYVTDPQCPYCKKGVETLGKMAAAGEVQVRFLLFPWTPTREPGSNPLQPSATRSRCMISRTVTVPKTSAPKAHRRSTPPAICFHRKASLGPRLTFSRIAGSTPAFWKKPNFAGVWGWLQPEPAQSPLPRKRLNRMDTNIAKAFWIEHRPI